MFHKWLKKYSPFGYFILIINKSFTIAIRCVNRYQSHTKNCKYCNDA